MMHGHEKSDLVSSRCEADEQSEEKLPAEASAGAVAAESVERRAGAKGNTHAGQARTGTSDPGSRVTGAGAYTATCAVTRPRQERVVRESRTYGYWAGGSGHGDARAYRYGLQELGATMKLPRRKFLRLAGGAAALPAVSRFAWAQAYPSRPVRSIVGFAPGGGNDTVARLIGQWLQEQLGQPFVDREPARGRQRHRHCGRRERACRTGYTLLLVSSGRM